MYRRIKPSHNFTYGIWRISGALLCQLNVWYTLNTLVHSMTLPHSLSHPQYGLPGSTLYIRLLCSVVCRQQTPRELHCTHGGEAGEAGRRFQVLFLPFMWGVECAQSPPTTVHAFYCVVACWATLMAEEYPGCFYILCVVVGVCFLRCTIGVYIILCSQYLLFIVSNIRLFSYVMTG